MSKIRSRSRRKSKSGRGEESGGGGEDFFEGGVAGLGGAEAGLAQGREALGEGLLAQVVQGRAAGNEFAQFVRYQEQFEDPHPSAAAFAPAGGAAPAPVEGCPV